MKHFIKQTLVRKSTVVVIAAILAVGIVQSSTTGPINPCITVPFCEPVKGNTGWITKQTMGFPLVYKEITTFTETKNKQQTSSSVEGINIGAILVNTLFWYALLDMIRRYIFKKKSEKHTTQ